MSRQEVTSGLNTPPFELVQEHTLQYLQDVEFQFSQKASIRRFRFIDCDAFTKNKVLKLVSFETLPVLQYSCISYVWNGLRPLRKTPCFSVNGIRDAHPLNIEILTSACLLSLLKGAQYLWLDLICILQTDLEDKIWQITRMSSIYANCSCCLVLSGGLQRLAKLHSGEQTTWAERLWTLQESVLPKHIYCLYDWRHGSGTLSGQAKITKLNGEVHNDFQSVLITKCRKHGISLFYRVASYEARQGDDCFQQ
jgi:hypothetical protein